MNDMNSAHLGRLVQGLRDEVADLRRRLGNGFSKEAASALPCFATTQDHDDGNALESAWMLGRGEEDQPNAQACFLQNYWLRVDRDPGTEALHGGTVQGRLDLRMNGDDAVLFCHAVDTAEESDFTTLLDFANLVFRMQRGTDATFDQSFQADLSHPDSYLLSLSRAEFQFFRVTLADAGATAAWSVGETTGFVMTDAPAESFLQIKNGAAKTAIHLIADTTIDIDTGDVDGNACKFHPWTRDGKALTPPLYVLSSAPEDLGLPCVFQWAPDSGSLGIGTDADCSALLAFEIKMGFGLNLTAGGTASSLKLEGGSGWFQAQVEPDEDVSAHWHSGSANIAVGLGTGTNGIAMDFGSGLTINLLAGDAAAYGGGGQAIQFREIQVCESGTAKKMIVLGSATYS